MSRSLRYPLTLQALEARLTPSNVISRAIELGFYADAKVNTSEVRGNALAVLHNTVEGGLGNFPTGYNSDFIVLSTGDATKAYGPRGTYPDDGLDWGIRGSADDQQTLRFTIPIESYHHHLRFDLNFMTDEVPGPDNIYNDNFFILAQPKGGGIDQAIAQMSVNDDLFLSTPPVNAIYARHTGSYTVDYEIPTGATSVELVIVLSDYPFSFNANDRDGKGDSALVLDNFRFQSRQAVWLNFEGGTFDNYPLEGGTTTFPAFQPADIRSAAERTALINSIVADVAAKFAAYDINLTLTQPPGPALFSTIRIGGTRATPITVGSGADPRLLAKYGTNTTIQAVKGNVFGHAESDYGNTHGNSRGFVLSGAFGLSPTYTADDETTLRQRLVVTIAHEIAHSLGAPHVADQFDDNIMADKPPRSPYAYFEDVRRPIVGTLPDKRTELNIHGYLASVLGLAAGTGFVNGPALGANGRFFRLNFGINLFDVRVGVSSGAPDSEDDSEGGVEWFRFNALHAGENEIELPNVTPHSRITFYGSTTAGGPPDFFSGTPNAGMIDYEESFLPLFDSNSVLHTSLAAATGELGSAVPITNGVGLGVSPYAFAGLKPMPKGGFTYTDVDGDTVVVKLKSSRGTGLIQLEDPDGDGRSYLGRIDLRGTTTADTLSIAVRKSATGNGYVDVGTIVAPALRSISAARANLVEEGVTVGSYVRSLSFRDILNGADVTTGGHFGTSTSMSAHDIGDGTTITVDGRLSLAAARVGDGTIQAAMLTKLSVRGDVANSIRGDFKSDVTIKPGKTLSTTEARLNLLGRVLITGKTEGATFVVPGHVGTFRTGTFEQSSLLVGFTPTDVLNPLMGGTWGGDFRVSSFSALGFNGYTDATFSDSQVMVARLGSVTITNLDDTNSRRPVGFGVKAGLLKNHGTIVLKNPVMKLLSTMPLPITITDFVIQEL